MSIKVFITSIALTYNPWTNVLGLSRSLLATGTLLTMVSNDTNILFKPASGLSNVPICDSVSQFGLFCILKDNLDIAQLIGCLILMAVIVGSYPRYSCFFHWWVSYSFNSSATLVNGGDQLTAVLTILLVPICLADNRTNHWKSGTTPNGRGFIQQIFVINTWVAYLLVRIQVCFLYFNAFVSKLKIDEWINGTALYYYFQSPLLGTSSWLSPVLMPLMSNPFIVTASTWGVILLEVVLFVSVVLPSKNAKKVLGMGIIFHILIAIFFGLISFFFACAAGLILYLHPVEKSFMFNKIIAKWKRLFTVLRLIQQPK